MDDHLIHYQLVDMINQMMKKVQIPVHQLLEAPRQLPLPSVRELESDIVMQQEQDVGSNLRAQPFVSQHVDNISNSQERRLAYDPLHNGVRLFGKVITRTG